MVVLPTPPFWFAIARTLPIGGESYERGPVGTTLRRFAREPFEGTVRDRSSIQGRVSSSCRCSLAVGGAAVGDKDVIGRYGPQAATSCRGSARRAGRGVRNDRAPDRPVRPEVRNAAGSRARGAGARTEAVRVRRDLRRPGVRRRAPCWKDVDARFTLTDSARSSAAAQRPLATPRDAASAASAERPLARHPGRRGNPSGRRAHLPNTCRWRCSRPRRARTARHLLDRHPQALRGSARRRASSAASRRALPGHEHAPRAQQRRRVLDQHRERRRPPAPSPRRRPRPASERRRQPAHSSARAVTARALVDARPPGPAASITALLRAADSIRSTCARRQRDRQHEAREAGPGADVGDPPRAPRASATSSPLSESATWTSSAAAGSLTRSCAGPARPPAPPAARSSWPIGRRRQPVARRRSASSVSRETPRSPSPG